MGIKCKLHRFTVNRKYIAGTLNTGAVRVKMMFPLSPESESVTFRSRISEPILRVCIRDGELTIVKPGVDRNASLKITDFCADGTGDTLACSINFYVIIPMILI